MASCQLYPQAASSLWIFLDSFLGCILLYSAFLWQCPMESISNNMYSYFMFFWFESIFRYMFVFIRYLSSCIETVPKFIWNVLYFCSNLMPRLFIFLDIFLHFRCSHFCCRSFSFPLTLFSRFSKSNWSTSRILIFSDNCCTEDSIFCNFWSNV